MAWSGIQNIKTVNAHLKRLKDSGLLKITNFVGEQSGSIYEIFLPEDIGLKLDADLDQTQTITRPNPDQKMDSDQTQKMVWVGSGNHVENKGTYEIPKTSLKTLRYIDDEAPVIQVVERLNETARKLTGKDLTRKDLENLSDLIEMLINETVVAAARTGSISATIPFMTENLRRRLYSKARPDKKEGKRPLHLEVGKGSEKRADENVLLLPQTPLTEEQRQNTLAALKEAKETRSIFINEFNMYGEIEYTSDDFQWLKENLEAYKIDNSKE